MRQTVALALLGSFMSVSAQNTLITLYPIKYQIGGGQANNEGKCWQADMGRNIISFETCDKTQTMQSFQVSTDGLIVAGDGPYSCVVTSQQSSTALFLNVCDPRAVGQIWQVDGPDVPIPVPVNHGLAICPRQCDAVDSIVCGYSFNLDGDPVEGNTCTQNPEGVYENIAFTATITEATGRYEAYNPSPEPSTTSSSAVASATDSPSNPTDTAPASTTDGGDPQTEPTKQPNQGELRNDDGTISTGLIFGVTAGIIVLLAVIACVVGMYLHKNRQKRKNKRKLEGANGTQMKSIPPTIPTLQVYPMVYSQPAKAAQGNTTSHYSGSVASIPVSATYSPSPVFSHPAESPTSMRQPMPPVSAMQRNESPLAHHHELYQQRASNRLNQLSPKPEANTTYTQIRPDGTVEQVAVGVNVDETEDETEGEKDRASETTEVTRMSDTSLNDTSATGSMYTLDTNMTSEASVIPGSTTIALECHHVEDDENVVMVGSEEPLGDWDPAMAPVMQRQVHNPNMYVLTVCNGDDEPIPYKFARITKDHRRVVWMQGGNLLLDPSSGNQEQAFSWVL
ncbi:hypothetical protein SARC_11414 [Sphaeroforma arctica JP610]|uniref:CBM20 domain-containing protein n=1 Tax=Sphaeroforma arctica JP610 TaxID=667725 RepID=A0A0L0FJA3_9EUKA|nr:hypothetical protein SARC_11414 [Sphaeroforma arctica JP610]KNC76078.1 hypothetical protein SARC_11414 [Sphaeroforma arctica JP610]|eukprot:XP_014149980.1 hypothetical protein SARC_11414 [Sphaeroforma arctica JP610]